MNIGFAGSDDFSLKILSGLTEMTANGSFNLSLVLTMPARNRGRGQILTENPIYSFSKKNNFFVEKGDHDVHEEHQGNGSQGQKDQLSNEGYGL